MHAEILREVRGDDRFQYVEVWHTMPPRIDEPYRVLQEEWVLAETEGPLDERHIHDIDRTPHISLN